MLLTVRKYYFPGLKAMIISYIDTCNTQRDRRVYASCALGHCNTLVTAIFSMSRATDGLLSVQRFFSAVFSAFATERLFCRTFTSRMCICVTYTEAE